MGQGFRVWALVLSAACAVSGAGAFANDRCRDIVLNTTCTGADQNSVAAGQVVACRIWVSNQGACDLAAARIVDRLPPRTKYLDAIPYPALQGNGEVTWTGEVLAGHAYRVDLAFRVHEPARRIITNTVCLTHPNIETECASWNLWVKESK